MQLIDGKAISELVKQEIAAEVAGIVAKGGKRPHLAAILVGHDGGSETYVAAKVKACEVCGFKSSLIRYEADVTEEELLAKVRELNEDADVDGFIVQLPLPKHISEQKVIETIGEEKEREVQKKVDAKKVEKISSTEPSFVRKGKPLCIEPISGRPFEMDLEDVKAAINRLNYRLTGGMEECISLSEWYDEIGLKHTDVSDYMGWNIYSDGLITITEVPSSTDDGELCWTTALQV